MGKQIVVKYLKQIYVGPAGWSYPDWKNTVFPSNISQNFDPIRFLSKYFDIVEINTTFYRIPPVKNIINWIKRVEDRYRFLFTVKAYRGFSHEPGSLTRDDISAFNACIAQLEQKGRLGAVLVQFPYRFHQNFENRKYIIKIRQDLTQWPLIFEFRHRSWFHPAILEFLRELNIGFCAIDQPAVSASVPLVAKTTSSIGYVRCHGRNREHWFDPEGNRDMRYNYHYKKEELEEIANIAMTMISSIERLFVVFNNHFKGNEVFDAAHFTELIKGKRLWPKWWQIAGKCQC